MNGLFSDKRLAKNTVTGDKASKIKTLIPGNMKKIYSYGNAFLLVCFFALTSIVSNSQQIKAGKIITHQFLAASIQGNKGGEDPMRRVSVYLPPGYDEKHDRYPVIYFLHGFDANDSLMIEWLGFKNLMDRAIGNGTIRPTILVLPNSDTRFKGSFYSNSPLTGKWSDYIGKDVVSYIDKNFKTIANRNSRGLAGHSMGGHGALKIGMLFPEVFGAVYAMSPGALHWSKEFNIDNTAFKKISEIKNVSEIFKGSGAPDSTEQNTFLALVFTSIARTFSPRENAPPFNADFPVRYDGKNMLVNKEAIEQWEKNFPINMIKDHIPALKSFNALKIDWGRNDDFPHIPVTSLEFSKRLEIFKIPHFAEEYIGDHFNQLIGGDGRLYTDLLPFFNRYLEFQKVQTQ